MADRPGPAADPAAAAGQALQDLVTARDAEQVRAAFGRHPVLQKPGLDALLTRLIRAAWEGDDRAGAAVFVASRAFLARCRADGVEASLEAGPALPLHHGGALGQLLLLGEAAAAQPQRAAAAQQALADLRPESEPEMWAAVNDELADSLAGAAGPEAIPQLETAVAAGRQALAVWDRPPHAGSPKQARTRQALFAAARSLATAYCERGQGDHGQDIETALAILETVLAPPLAAPGSVAWGRAQMVLGNAYILRQRGSRKENLQRALKCHTEALAAFPLPDHAEDWARACYNLAIAYRQMPPGSLAGHLQHACHYYAQALRVFTATAHPAEWASIQAALGDVYGQREFGGRPRSLQDAQRCYRAALETRTPERNPAGWATLQNNLGNVCAEQAEDEADPAVQRQLLRQAITYYAAALTERPRTRFPARWAETVNNLGVAYSQGPTGDASADFERAVNYLRQALEVHTPQRYPRACRRAALNLARLLFGQRQWEAAQDAYAAAIAAMNALYREAVTEPGRQSELAQARGVFANRAYALARLGRLDEAAACLESGRARAVSVALARNTALLAAAPGSEREAFIAARDRLAALEAEARWVDDAFDADPDRPRPARDPVAIMDELAQARADFAAHAARLQTQRPDFLPAEWAAADIAGVAAQTGRPLVYLETTPFGGLALIVPPATPLTVVWLDALASDHLTGHAARLLSDSLAGDARALSQALAALWPVLQAACLQPVSAALQDRGYTQAALIPGGLLGLLPLPAAAAEAAALSCVPSARALQAAQAAAGRRPAQPDRWLGVGAPTNALKPLPFARLEVDEIGALFTAGPAAGLSGEAATSAAVTAALSGATHLHFACHGQFNLEQPLASALALAGADGLSLRHVLEGGADLTAARLVVLSACESGLIDVRHVPDEVVGFPAGFLQAGAAGVVSTLWPVDDLSTALLMIQFYTYLWREAAPPVEALRRAQLWLRAATNAELSERLGAVQPDGGGAAAARAKFLEFTLADPDGRPFEQPFYWAPFIYYGA